MDTEISRMKKELIETASPGTLEELQRAGGFNSRGGLYQFLRHHKAEVERKSIFNVKFPVVEE